MVYIFFRYKNAMFILVFSFKEVRRLFYSSAINRWNGSTVRLHTVAQPAKATRDAYGDRAQALG